MGRDARRCPLRTRPPSWGCLPLLPRWLRGKESVCSAGEAGSIPGWGKSPGEGNGNPLQYSCLGESTDRGAWRATVYSLQGHKELDTTERRTLSFFFKSSGQPCGHLPSGHVLFACPPTPSPCGPPSPSQSLGGSLVPSTRAPSSHAAAPSALLTGRATFGGQGPALPAPGGPRANAVGHSPPLALEEQWERAADALLDCLVPRPPAALSGAHSAVVSQ